METIEIFEQLELFDERYLDGDDYFDVLEDSKFLNEQIEKLIRRQFKDGENYYVVMAGLVGLWSGDRFGSREIDINNFTVFFDSYYTNVFLDEDGTLRINYYHHDGVHRMELYLIESEAYEMNPYHMEDYLFDKEAIRVDAKFMKAYGFSKRIYDVIKK